MKRIITALLMLCILMSLSACCIRIPASMPEATLPQAETPEPTPAPEAETTAPETAAPETAAPETEGDSRKEYTIDEFSYTFRGVWIFDDTVSRIAEDMVTFDLMLIQDGSCTTGWYPGEYSRPGRIKSITAIAENTYRLELVFEAGMYMDEYYSESRSTVTFILPGNGKLRVKYENGKSYNLTYGGKTTYDASLIAGSMVPYQAPTEPEPTVPDRITITPSTQVISEHTGYRIIREDRSGRNSAGQVVVSQYQDYVELTADTSAAQKINNALKPDLKKFLSESDLADYAGHADPEYPFCNQFYSDITYWSDKWLCVTISSDWCMGGVHNAGNSGFVFDLATGEQVTLRSFAGSDPAAFETQLKQIVWEQIQPQEPWENSYETLCKYTLDTFNFAISNGQIVLYFPEYEFFPGAYGPVTVNTGIYI